MVEKVRAILIHNVWIGLVLMSSKIVPHQIIGCKIVCAFGAQQIEIHLKTNNILNLI